MNSRGICWPPTPPGSGANIAFQKPAAQSEIFAAGNLTRSRNGECVQNLGEARAAANAAQTPRPAASCSPFAVAVHIVLVPKADETHPRSQATGYTAESPPGGYSAPKYFNTDIRGCRTGVLRGPPDRCARQPTPAARSEHRRPRRSVGRPASRSRPAAYAARNPARNLPRKTRLRTGSGRK